MREREAKRQREAKANEDGFRDALSIGRRDPGYKAPSERVAYDRGFREGERAAKRIVALAKGEVRDMIAHPEEHDIHPEAQEA